MYLSAHFFFTVAAKRAKISYEEAREEFAIWVSRDDEEDECVLSWNDDSGCDPFGDDCEPLFHLFVGLVFWNSKRMLEASTHFVRARDDEDVNKR